MVLPARRFEEAHVDLPGLWGEPNSSIDWCERNYVVTYYVAEFWNTVSNACLLASGLFAFAVARRFNMEMRWQVHGLAWAFVAFGSMLFHSMLWYSSQLLDELPMVYAALVWCYCLLGIYDDRKARLLRISFAAYAVLWTLLHARGAFTVLFQLQYAVLILTGVALTDRSLRLATGHGVFSFLFTSDSVAPRSGLWMLVHLVRCHIAWLAIAFVLWISDQLACEHWHALPINPQLHAWWHVLVAVSVHIGFHTSMSYRLAEQRGAVQKVGWVWLFYYIPITTEVAPEE